ncbi:hypothetical protein MXB_3393, partial [Myxobolus squamalis]
ISMMLASFPLSLPILWLGLTAICSMTIRDEFFTFRDYICSVFHSIHNQYEFAIVHPNLFSQLNQITVLNLVLNILRSCVASRKREFYHIVPKFQLQHLSSTTKS